MDKKDIAAPRFEHVSDTALLVAACRAMETERPDALVRDPFAAKLAGEKGMALANAISVGKEFMTYGVGMRARLIDELLIGAIQGNEVGTVVNLGAGLDTRPWRLELPNGLHWIEVDFPAILDYKSAVLAGELPRCRLERASLDLNDASQRSETLRLASSRDGRALMITEGLLMYLPAATLQALAAETFADSLFRFWIFDVFSPELMRLAHQGAVDEVNRLRPETHTKGKDTLNVLESAGWSPVERRSMIPDAANIGQSRLMEMAHAAAATGMAASQPPDDGVSGVWLYEAKR